MNPRKALKDWKRDQVREWLKHRVTVSITDLQSLTMYSAQVQVAALSVNQAVSFDVTSFLNASIAAGDSVLTLRIHYATQNTDGTATNEGIEFLGMNGAASCYPTLTIQ